MKIYILTCEDASHLGGPMGSEYTTPVETEIFKSLKSAQAYAEGKHWNDDSEWMSHRDGHWSADVLAYIWSIETKELR